MKEKYNYFLCFLSSTIACVLSVLVLLITTLEINDAVVKVENLENKVEQYSELVSEQNKEIEFYKNYVDDVVRCIVDEEW